MNIRRILCTTLASAMMLGTAVALTTISTSAAVPTYISVAQPKTNISGDLALIRPIDSAEELDAMVSADQKPATAIYTVDKDLNVLDSQGNAFSTIDTVMEKTGYTVIPAFRMTGTTVGTTVANHMKSIGMSDCIFISPSATTINTARKVLPEATGILDYTGTMAGKTELTEDECVEIRRTVKSKNVTAIMLPAKLCTQETVQFLYERQVNVWARTSDTPTVEEQYDAILSGAIGIVSDATDSYLDIACNKLPANTMTRMPINIGHRGLPNYAPENTLEGAIAAYERGANAVELDFYLTSDGHAVAMHSSWTGDTCNENLYVESNTLDRLKQLYVNKKFEASAKFSQCRIPTIEEFFEYFQGKDCHFYIEIKSKNTAIIPVIKAAIDQYNMYGQCTIISMEADMMKACREQYPEMALGAIFGDFMYSENPDLDLREATAYIGPYNATMHPTYVRYGNVYYFENDVRTALFRGVSINPWTFTNLSSYAPYFLWGYTGLTGDGASTLGRLTTDVSYIPTETTYKVGDTLPMSLELNTYVRNTSTQKATITIVNGGDCAKVNDNVLTFTGAGEVTVLLSYTHNIVGAGSYTLYEHPVTFTVEADVPETQPETQPGTQPETDPETQPETDPETQPETDPTLDTEPVTTPETDPETATDSEPDETTDEDSKDEDEDDDKSPDDEGCSSTLDTLPLLVLVTASAAAVLFAGRRKKDETTY